MGEISKWYYRYMSIAEEVANWSTCLSRKVGCVITVNNRIVATGYNGAPAGIKTCLEKGKCFRCGSKSGENLDMCLAAHAEQNALMQAAKQGVSIDGGVMFCTTQPCTTCAKMIINSGIKEIVYLEEYPNQLAKELLFESGILLTKLEI